MSCADVEGWELFAGVSFLDSEVGAFVIRLLSKYFISIYKLQLHYNFYLYFQKELSKYKTSWRIMHHLKRKKLKNIQLFKMLFIGRESFSYHP